MLIIRRIAEQGHGLAAYQASSFEGVDEQDQAAVALLDAAGAGEKTAYLAGVGRMRRSSADTWYDLFVKVN